MALRSRGGEPLSILSLCAGVGGLDLGVKLALNHLGLAGRGVVYVEGEAAAASSLVASMEAGWLHPAPIWSDMRTFDARPWCGVVDIIASGDPCQDNSVAGKGAGADGERFLASEVTRIAEECRPDLIFRENVPGNADGQIEAIVPALEELGYRVAAGIFSSSETGNTMRRERLFIMAERVDDAAGSRCDASWVRPKAVRKGWECLPSSGCNELARPKSERCGEAGRDSGRSEEWTGGPEPAMGSPIRCSDGRRSDGSLGKPFGRIAPNRTGDIVEQLGCASNTEPQGQQRGQHHPSGRKVQSGSVALSGRAAFSPAVIPGPTSPIWRDIIDRWPELQPALSEEEAQSHLRRGVDAMAHRIERLRATGNGVDPLVAAYAFLSLHARLIGS